MKLINKLILTAFFPLSSFLVAHAQQELAGTTSETAKVLNIDQFGSFKDNFCVVRKGNKCAIIDTSGNFVLGFEHPYIPAIHDNIDVSNGQGLLQDYQTGFSEGLCAVVDVKTGLLGYINTKMQLVIPCKFTRATLFKNGYAEVSWRESKNASLNMAYIDKTGKIVHLKNYSTDPRSNVLVPFRKVVHQREIHGFSDFFGKELIPAKYVKVRPFSEGMAAVLKTDEFGKEKWGYINTKGEEVIACKFSKAPGDFHNGLAFVVPNDQSEFIYAYIDKQGNIKIKVDKSYATFNKTIKNLWAPGEHNAFGNFREGFAPLNPGQGLNYILIDTTGQPYNFPQFKGPLYNRESKKSFASDPQKSYVSGNYSIQEPFFVNGLALFGINGQLYGIMNSNSDIIIPPVFNHLELPTCPAKIYRAKYRTFNQTTRETKTKDGFINQQGIFIILKGDEPKW